MLDLHAARIIPVAWHVHVPPRATTRLCGGLGHITRRLSVGHWHVVSWLSVGLGPIAVGLRIVPRKHDLLILHSRSSSGEVGDSEHDVRGPTSRRTILPAHRRVMTVRHGHRTWRRFSRSTLPSDPFIFLNLAFSTQAACAAALILLAGNQSAVRDRATLEHTADEAEDADKKDAEILARLTRIEARPAELAGSKS